MTTCQTFISTLTTEAAADVIRWYELHGTSLDVATAHKAARDVAAGELSLEVEAMRRAWNSGCRLPAAPAPRYTVAAMSSAGLRSLVAALETDYAEVQNPCTYRDLCIARLAAVEIGGEPAAAAAVHAAREALCAYAAEPGGLRIQHQVRTLVFAACPGHR